MAPVSVWNGLLRDGTTSSHRHKSKLFPTTLRLLRHGKFKRKIWRYFLQHSKKRLATLGTSGLCVCTSKCHKVNKNKCLTWHTTIFSHFFHVWCYNIFNVNAWIVAHRFINTHNIQHYTVIYVWWRLNTEWAHIFTMIALPICELTLH